MKAEYDFSKSKPNPYSKLLKKDVNIVSKMHETMEVINENSDEI